VCLFWGTTYLGIRIALESFSPAMLMCLRYSASGGLLLVGALLAGARFPTRSELWRTALCGLMAIGCGTGSLVFAEQWIPSGLAALIVSTQPFWMVGVEALMPGGERLRLPAAGGMLVGLAGVAFLIAPEVSGGGVPGISSNALLGGFLLLQVGELIWSLGSSGQRRIAGRAHPFVSGAVHQLATGMVFAIPAMLDPRPAVWNTKGILAVAYLAVFGGIVGYSAFTYSMHHLPVALVSIYTYINPIVAVALGWWFYREPFGWREGVAMLVIFAGVAMVKWASPAGLRRVARREPSVPIE
jgi:drug/metabolite transporter (DMT)-like permease